MNGYIFTIRASLEEGLWLSPVGSKEGTVKMERNSFPIDSCELPRLDLRTLPTNFGAPAVPARRLQSLKCMWFLLWSVRHLYLWIAYEEYQQIDAATRLLAYFENILRFYEFVT
jgi:hypothetical protein